MTDAKTKARYPVAAAFALALAGGGLFTLTSRHEGTGPVETISVAEAEKRGTVGVVGAMPEAQAGFVELVKSQQIAVMRAYPDPGHGWAMPTICYGHTRGVKKGMTATKAQCEAWLIEDYNDLVLPELKKHVRVPVSKGEAIALADFVFNVGGPKFSTSTLLRKLNAGDYAGAADEFGKWIYSNGKRLAGLVKRRAAEREIFISG
jgi:lysozyme